MVVHLVYLTVLYEQDYNGFIVLHNRDYSGLPFSLRVQHTKELQWPMVFPLVYMYLCYIYKVTGAFLYLLPEQDNIGLPFCLIVLLIQDNIGLPFCLIVLLIQDNIGLPFSLIVLPIQKTSVFHNLILLCYLYKITLVFPFMLLCYLYSRYGVNTVQFINKITMFFPIT